MSERPTAHETACGVISGAKVRALHQNGITVVYETDLANLRQLAAFAAARWAPEGHSFSANGSAITTWWSCGCCGAELGGERDTCLAPDCHYAHALLGAPAQPLTTTKS